ncbi:hypothetical protein LOTGIDRAFT_144270, partial [Lottia gigantea]
IKNRKMNIKNRKLNIKNRKLNIKSTKMSITNRCGKKVFRINRNEKIMNEMSVKVN